MKNTLLIILLFVCTFFLHAQNITYISQTQEGKKIRVSYTLDEKADISLYYSEDGGVTRVGPLKQVTGDVGEKVSAGHNSILWDVFAEVDQLKGDNIVFIVEADPIKVKSSTKNYALTRRKTYAKNTFITFDFAASLSPLLSYGLSFGQVRRWGWFLSFASNYNFSSLPYSSLPNGTYTFMGNESKLRVSLMGGVLFRIAKPVSIYLGAGYGCKGVYYETNMGYWVENPLVSYYGIDASLGILLDVQHFVLKGEVVTTNFKYVEIKVGIGYSIETK